MIADLRCGTFPTERDVRLESAFRGKAEVISWGLPHKIISLMEKLDLTAACAQSISAFDQDASNLK
ncbi:hypothetical protein [Bradyrhizobium sp.]|uniref:hypothetical protein n=1 Tax=Bradyrhizobium sp. TaxID=376 RepID=UPI003BAF9EAC